MDRSLPSVDVNILAYNSEQWIASAIESVLAQTWPNIELTIIDNRSTDDTIKIARNYQKSVPWIHVYPAAVNGGSILNCERAFMLGSAEFVMPKTADDIIAPDFVEKAMTVLLNVPDCVMCHAAGLIFTGDGTVTQTYPKEHRLHAVDEDIVERARHVMMHYTSAPSFWGVYRRSAVHRLARFRYAAGWDHAVLAELALYGEIRHVPEVLYFRRDGGKSVRDIARACNEAVQRGHELADQWTDFLWMTPLITTAFNHIDVFSRARVDQSKRLTLIEDAARIFARDGCRS